MKIYIDSEFRCHTTNIDNTLREIETDFFDDKCTVFIEGYRFVPDCESWTRSDGVVFRGEMISPWRPLDELLEAQRDYETELDKARIATLEEALEMLLAGVTE